MMGPIIYSHARFLFQPPSHRFRVIGKGRWTWKPGTHHSIYLYRISTDGTRSLHYRQNLKRKRSQLDVDATQPKAAPSLPHRPIAPHKIFLPIKSWFLGLKRFDDPYHLVWTPAGKMIIRSGDGPGTKAEHSEEIEMGMVAHSVSVRPDFSVDININSRLKS